MTVLDTFYLLFRTNADEIKKGTQDAGKSADELEKKLNSNNKAAKELGESFTGIVDNLGKIVLAYIGLDALRGGVSGAEKFTASLQMNSQWLGINAKQLAAWDEAMQTVGGAPGQGIATIKSMHDQFVRMGFGSSMPDFIKALKEESRQFRSMSLEQAEMVGMKQGLPEAAILLMRQGDAVDALVDKMASLNGVTDEGTKIARAFDAQWVETRTTFQGLFIDINNQILPAITDLLKKADEFILKGKTGDKPEDKYDDFPDYVDKEGLGSVLLHVLKRGFGGMASAARFAAAGYQSREEREKYYREQGFWWADPAPPDAPPSANTALGVRSNNPGNLQPGGRESTYATPEQGLAAMADNLRRYGRNGWNSIEDIISHWSPADGKGNSPASTEAYKAAVAASTGYGRGQKLDLNDPATLDALMKSMIKQENSDNPYSDTQIMHAFMLGKQALNSVSQSPFNSTGGSGLASASGGSSISVKTGDIHVHTQATDAQGIAGAIGTSLRNQIRMTVSGVDDGVLA